MILICQTVLLRLRLLRVASRPPVHAEHVPVESPECTEHLHVAKNNTAWTFLSIECSFHSNSSPYHRCPIVPPGTFSGPPSPRRTPSLPARLSPESSLHGAHNEGILFMLTVDTAAKQYSIRFVLGSAPCSYHIVHHTKPSAHSALLLRILGRVRGHSSCALTAAWGDFNRYLGVAHKSRNRGHSVLCAQGPASSHPASPLYRSALPSRDMMLSRQDPCLSISELSSSLHLLLSVQSQFRRSAPFRFDRRTLNPIQHSTRLWNGLAKVEQVGKLSWYFCRFCHFCIGISVRSANCPNRLASTGTSLTSNGGCFCRSERSTVRDNDFR